MSPRGTFHVDEIHLERIQDEQSSTSSSSSAGSTPVASMILSLLEQTKPKRLVLRDCNLSVSDLFNIMNVLCRKHYESLECLDLRHNRFPARAIQWILAIHLGSLRNLKEIYLRQGIRCIVHQNVRNAILDGLDNNTNLCLETIDLFEWDRSIEHLLDINRAGRKVLFQDESFPISLWPQLLERATNEESLTKNQPVQPPKRRIVARQASVLYHILRNGPILLQNHK